MFIYRPYSVNDLLYLNPIIVFNSTFLTVGLEGFADYVPKNITGEYGALIGVKHNVWPLIKFLGIDLVYELTSYTRLQTCAFMRQRALFRVNLIQMQYQVHYRLYFLILKLQNIHPEPLIWYIG